MAAISGHAHGSIAEAAAANGHGHSTRAMWGRLALMSAISFGAMYGLMYMMVDGVENVLPSVNQVYMAGMMTAAMVVIEVLVMSPMYPQKRIAIPVVLVSAAALVAFVWMTRRQVGVDDEQFVRSMIPHHAGAVLMCNQADLSDAELRDLCERIVRDQRAEIAFMKRKLPEVASR